MSAFADLTYYKSTYLGTTIADADFPQLALRATSKVEALTFGRASTTISDNIDMSAIDNIKMATCAVAEEIQRQNVQGDIVGIQSESVGNNSVTYSANSSMMKTSLDKIRDVMKIYLVNTGLMFAGLDDAD